MSLICDRTGALEFLLGRVNYERTTNVPYQTNEFKLDRMRRLMAHLGDPHLRLKALHIAGTKGKGSTAAMLAAVLQSAGYCTGLYTSPHLEAIEERIAIDGRQCSEADFVALAAEVQTATERLEREFHESNDSRTGPTFFEVTTAMAFLHFARRGVEAAVLEVGLGGRLDSTNICLPSVSVVTSISYDHTKQLGHTLAAIAGEKAGIIKPGVPVISGVVNSEPRQVIERIAAEQQARLYQRGSEFDFETVSKSSRGAESVQRLTYREPTSAIWPEIRDLSLGMIGEHQAANAAVAIAALARLVDQGWSVTEENVRHGLASARCTARIEVLSQRPAVICDVSHNVASIAALVKVLQERFAAPRRVLIFASSKDKDARAMLRLLLPEFDRIVFTRYIHNPRAVEPAELEAIARDLVESEMVVHEMPRRPQLETAADPAAALFRARQVAKEDDLLCITGSFFLAAELQGLLPVNKLSPAGKH